MTTLSDLQASLRQLRANRTNESVGRRFYTNGFVYFVEGGAKCWWCHHETLEAATEMLQLFSIQKTAHTEKFKQTMAEQLITCEKCLVAYYAAKNVLYKRYCEVYDPRNVELVFQNIRVWDSQRILLQFSRSLLPSSPEGRIAVIDALAGAENLLFLPEVESATCSFINRCVERGVRLDIGSVLLPGHITLCFVTNQRVRDWARRALRRTKGSHIRLDSVQLVFTNLFKQLAARVSTRGRFQLLPKNTSTSSEVSKFPFATDGLWHGLRDVFARLPKSCVQDLVATFDDMAIVTCQALLDGSGPEFFDVLHVFSRVISHYDPQSIWPRIEQAIGLTAIEFVKRIFRQTEVRQTFFDCGAARGDLGEESLALCSRQLRPVRDWITPFIGSLQLPSDSAAIVAILEELLLNIRTDNRVPPASAALAVHTAIAIVMHCLKLPPAKNISGNGLFILVGFLNQNMDIFIDIAQGQSLLSESELLITGTESLIDLMIREDLSWSLKAVSEISDQAQNFRDNPEFLTTDGSSPYGDAPVLVHFPALWTAILQNPKNTILFKKALYGVSYLLLFDPLPQSLTACLPPNWRNVYQEFEKLRSDIKVLLKGLLETLAASLENVDLEMRNELEKDILSSYLRLLVSPAKSIYPEVLRVLRVSLVDISDDDLSDGRSSRAPVDLTDSERDLACLELYERHKESFVGCMTSLAHDCNILVSYSRPAYSCCSNVALFARSSLSIFTDSSSSKSSESLAQLFYGFCGLLGSILKNNAENSAATGSDRSIYMSAVPIVFRTVYDMLNSSEFADYVRIAKDSQGVNENEAMDALSTCVSQMLIYLQSEDALGVASRIIRTFGLIANGLATIPGASMMYPEQLVQELIEGKSGCLIAEQRRLLSVITSKPVWQARRVAVSETKPVQINIDEIEAFSAMDNFDLSDVFGDVEIEPSPVVARTMPSQTASTSVSAPKPTYKSDEDSDVVVVVDTPHKHELPKSNRAISDDDDDIMIVEPNHYASVAAPHREAALAAEPKHDFSRTIEAKSESEPVQEVVFTAADATKAQRKQTYMDHWVSRSKPQSMGQPSLTSQLASRARATSSASRAASSSKKVGGGVISKMRSSFAQERSATIPNRMPKIPKQVVKPSRALPSVPTEFWAANRLGGSIYGSYTPTVTSVRDVSQQAMLEHEQEKRRRAKERAARSQESSDLSSSDDDETQKKGGLAGLIDSVKSPMRAPRRTMMMASSNIDSGGIIRTFGGGTTFVDQQARERAAAKQRAKMRLMPSMAALHKHILGWGFDSTGDVPPNFSTDALRKIPDQFEDYNLYIETFEPLFLLECWAQFQRAKEETASSDTSVATLKSHMGEDEFYELTFTMLPADAQQLTDGDVLVFAESQSREKQWAQGLSVGGTAPGARFSGKTFLAIVKKRLFGRAGAQVVVRVYFVGAQLAAHMSRLVLGSEWEWFCLFGMTPIHREFAALQSLPYLSENLVREILHPRMSLSYTIDSAEVRSCMKAHSLNQPQAESVVAAMRREHGFTLIQGPPGTGKTKTILGLVGALLSNSKDRAGKGKCTDTDSKDKPANKMLVCAPSNAAVDEIVKRLKSGIRDSKGSTFFPRVVRVGQASNVSSTVRDTTLDFLTDKAMDAHGTAARDPNVSVGQSELLLDIAARTQAARTVANAKGTQKAAQGLLRTLMKSLDEVNAEIRELDNQMQTVDPSNTALLSGIREKFRKVKSRKSKIYHDLDQERARAREASRTMDETRQAVRMQILQSTDVLCCTLSGSGHEMLASLKCTFDTVIIDEAAQSIELACLIPLKYECERCILVGDPKQLPPTVFSLPATQRLYNQSLFVRIQRNAPDAVNLLSIQYRMHPEISALPSRLFYESRLRDGPDMGTKQHAAWHDSERYRPYMFFDIAQGREQSGASHSVFNMDEVNAAVQLVFGLCSEYGKLNWNQKIGIITPYKQQLRKLVDTFSEYFGPTVTDAIEFNTVDGFQGQEKEVIIFSCVRAGDAGVGFLADRRRMNVGLTRARKSMFVLGNAKKLSISPIWNELVTESRARGLVAETRLPLFGRAVRRGVKFDCLLTEDVRSAQVADGEGDRTEFTMEELDEAELGRFNQAMARPKVADVADSGVVDVDMTDASVTDASVTAGSRKATEQRMHPALKSVEEDARKREAVLEARKRSRSRDAQSGLASKVDADSGDRAKRLRQSTDEPHSVPRAGIRPSAVSSPATAPTDRPKKSTSCLFIQRKRPGRGGRTGSVDRVRTSVVPGEPVVPVVRDASVVRERDMSSDKDMSLSRDRSPYKDRSLSRDRSQSRDRPLYKDRPQSRDRSPYNDRSRERAPPPPPPPGRPPARPPLPPPHSGTSSRHTTHIRPPHPSPTNPRPRHPRHDPPNRNDQMSRPSSKQRTDTTSKHRDKSQNDTSSESSSSKKKKKKKRKCGGLFRPTVLSGSGGSKRSKDTADREEMISEMLNN